MAKRKTTWPPDFKGVAELRPNRHRVYESVPVGGRFELPMPPGSEVSVGINIACDAYDGLYHYGLTLRQPMEKGGVSSFAPGADHKAFETAREAMKAAIKEAIGDLIQEGNPPGEGFRAAAIAHLWILITQLENSINESTNQPVNQEQRNPAMKKNKGRAANGKEPETSRGADIGEIDPDAPPAEGTAFVFQIPAHKPDPRFEDDGKGCGKLTKFKMYFTGVVDGDYRLTDDANGNEYRVSEFDWRGLWQPFVIGKLADALAAIQDGAKVPAEKVDDDWVEKNSSLIERAKKTIRDHARADGVRTDWAPTVGWLSEALTVSYDLACKTMDHLIDSGWARDVNPANAEAATGVAMPTPPAPQGAMPEMRQALIGRGLKTVRKHGKLSSELLAREIDTVPHLATKLFDLLVNEGYVGAADGFKLGHSAVVLKEADGTPVAAIQKPPTAVLTHLPVARHVELPASDIVVIPGRNHRRDFDPEKLNLLGESMKKLDQLQEVIINERKGDDGKKVYELVAGERRLRSAIAAEIGLIQCKVYRDLTPLQIAVAGDAENQRENLNHMELAYKYKGYLEGGLEVAGIKALTGDSDDTIRRHLALLKLADPVQQAVALGKLPVHSAELIAKVADPLTQVDIAGHATGSDWKGAKVGWVKQQFRGEDWAMSRSDLCYYINRAIQSLDGVPWPLDRTYAGKCACAGCPSNTASHAEEPELFAGLNLHASKSGNCADPGCYQAKLAQGEKDQREEAKKKEKQVKESIRKAKRAKIPVCENCAKISESGQEYPEEPEAGGKRLCPTCKKELKKAPSHGMGKSYEQQQKRLADMKRRFPWDAKQRFAVAMHEYGGKLDELIAARLKKAPTPPHAEAALLHLAILNPNGSDVMEDELPPLATVCQGTAYSPKHLAAMWSPLVPNFGPKPQVAYNAKVEGVPLEQWQLDAIQTMEVLADAWGVKRPQRPVEETRPDGALSDGELAAIVSGKSAPALAAIAKADLATLQGIKVQALQGDWRRAAVAKRIRELEKTEGRGEKGEGRFNKKVKVPAEVVSKMMPTAEVAEDEEADEEECDEEGED
jgi:ParB/RepB/Spo0J family partition protein